MWFKFFILTPHLMIQGNPVLNNFDASADGRIAQLDVSPMTWKALSCLNHHQGLTLPLYQNRGVSQFRSNAPISQRFPFIWFSLNTGVSLFGLNWLVGCLNRRISQLEQIPDVPPAKWVTRVIGWTPVQGSSSPHIRKGISRNGKHNTDIACSQVSVLPGRVPYDKSNIEMVPPPSVPDRSTRGLVEGDSLSEGRV